MVLYNPSSKGQAEDFVNTFKRALRKLNNEIKDKVTLQQFLRVYHVTSNPNIQTVSSQANLMFARKVKSAFDKLLQAKKRNSVKEEIARFFKVDEKMYIRENRNGMIA